jgi:hypothetical protein
MKAPGPAITAGSIARSSQSCGIDRTGWPELGVVDGENSMTRDEHLAWARERALEYLEAGDPASAIGSMISDLGKHEETRSLSLDRYAEAVDAAAAADTEAVRRWIEAFR